MHYYRGHIIAYAVGTFDKASQPWFSLCNQNALYCQRVSNFRVNKNQLEGLLCTQMQQV